LIAVVLAGGAGTRFWPFTGSKTLFPFFGQTLFDLTIARALPPEVDEVVLISNNDNQKALQSIKLSKPTKTILQPRPLGMADALISAKSELMDASLLIIIGDDIASPHLLSDVVKAARGKDVFAVIPGWKTPSYFPGGYLRVNEEKVLGIVEKPQPANVPSPYVAISGHFIADSNKLFEELGRVKTQTDDVYEQALTMLALRENIVFTPYEGAFRSLKYPWDVIGVLDVLFGSNFKSKRGKGVKIYANVVIEGEVVLGNNVKIFENTKIIGPCYVGDNTIIGNNNIIRQSHIGANCVTGFSTDITRSYIGDNCWFHSNYIGDSVLENDISMGGGAKLANLRLDDGEISSMVKNSRVKTGLTKLGAMIASGVRIGVNTSIMPGVKIGQGTFVGSGIVLDQDIVENSFVMPGKNSFTVSTNKHTGVSASREAFKKDL
jgi:UDP-N-acetylglucosamine diphosphorylase / glucose-1-phosphate thymidylyltransferase / UDP-N-acetylgalactosamine diphosphorylase / glucosamine-1-phosphate N-acetyltransferase / galactosamine-1-phosphate N-acetyltransferase